MFVAVEDGRSCYFWAAGWRSERRPGAQNTTEGRSLIAREREEEGEFTEEDREGKGFAVCYLPRTEERMSWCSIWAR